MRVHAFVQSVSFHVFAIMANSLAQLRKVLMGGTTQTCLFSVTEKITALSLMD